MNPLLPLGDLPVAEVALRWTVQPLGAVIFTPNASRTIVPGSDGAGAADGAAVAGPADPESAGEAAAVAVALGVEGTAAPGSAGELPHAMDSRTTSAMGRTVMCSRR